MAIWSYTKEQVYESIRMPYAERPYFTRGFPLASVLRQATRIASLSGAGVNDWNEASADRLTVDTGELIWRTSSNTNGLVVVDTPRSQALIGYVKANKIATGIRGIGQRALRNHAEFGRWTTHRAVCETASHYRIESRK